MEMLNGHQLLTPGSLIAGRYEVVRTLGSGGMGSVLQVIDRSLDNETIALKLLYPHLARDKTSFARFRNEVLVARRLSHPNIVRLYDFGHAGNGYYFISMEFVSGGSLGQMIYKDRRGPVPFLECLRILRDIAAGIGHAHSMGVVHRDLKPDNILLTERVDVKITDFGLARTLYIDKGFTDTGEAVGTPYYMAPEQLRGDRIDGRADIYALGIIAYEMLVGRRPFFDESYLNLAAKHINEPIPDFVTKENKLPLWIQDFVQMAAAKKPDQRFQTAEEIVSFLDEKMQGMGADDTLFRRTPAVLTFYSSTKVKLPSRKRMVKRVAWTIATLLVLAFVMKIIMRTEAFRMAATSTLLRAEQRTGIKLGMLKSFFGRNLSMSSLDLIAAVRSADANAVEALLSAGMNPNERDSNGVPLLSLALEKQDYPIARMFLSHGTDPNIRDAQKKTPLMYAVSGSDPNIVRELVNAGANIDAVDEKLWSVLMHAVKAGNIAAVQFLLKLNAMVESAADGTTPLMVAVQGGFEGIVRILLDRSKLDARDKDMKTALEHAVKRESESIVRMLIAEGADIKTSDGRTVADIASVRMKRIILEKLKIRQTQEVADRDTH